MAPKLAEWTTIPDLFDALTLVPLTYIREVCTYAQEYCRSTQRSTKQDALKQMTERLQKIKTGTIFRRALWTRHLDRLIHDWLTRSIQREQEKLEHTVNGEFIIDNPYAPGKALLQLGDPLFVGRWDLARRLGDGLSREKYRPVFQLNGESRMGKSSVLAQLPKRLDARYIPLFYDLQRSGVLASVATFLRFVAQKIEEVLSTAS